MVTSGVRKIVGPLVAGKNAERQRERTQNASKKKSRAPAGRNAKRQQKEKQSASREKRKTPAGVNAERQHPCFPDLNNLPWLEDLDVTFTYIRGPDYFPKDYFLKTRASSRVQPLYIDTTSKPQYLYPRLPQQYSKVRQDTAVSRDHKRPRAQHLHPNIQSDFGLCPEDTPYRHVRYDPGGRKATLDFSFPSHCHDAQRRKRASNYAYQ